MTQDNQDEKASPESLGRMYSGEVAPPITTPAAVAALQVKRAVYAAKPNAVAIQVYFAARRIENPIMQASMLAYTDVRIASNDDFDEIFNEHHEVPVSASNETEQEVKIP